MVTIQYEDLIGPSVITTLSVIQQCKFADKVARARRKYKIPAPRTDGDEAFVRVFRAHQNSSEFYPVFLASIWSSSILLHQGPSSALGLIYIAGRSMYFHGYCQLAEKRKPGYKVCMVSLFGMTACSLMGIVNLLIGRLTGKSLFRLLLLSD